jgi:hypothetical protein
VNKFQRQHTRWETSTSTTMTDRQRKVRFHSRVQFKTIRHVANFSDEEISAGWYCKKDFMRMSDEVSAIAKLVAAGQEVYNGEELCIRGLEHLVEEDVADYRAEKMIASIDAVLDEQDEQMDENIYDPYTIADVYGEIVAPLLREAYLVGLRDAKEGAAAAALIPDIPETSTPSIPSPQVEKMQNETDSNYEQSLDEDQREDLKGRVEVGDRIFGVNEVASDADHEGEENLNTSFNSIGVEVAPEKVHPTKNVVDQPNLKKMEQRRKDYQKNKGWKKDTSNNISMASADDPDNGAMASSQTSPVRAGRRKAIDRKSGTELSPFVFRRDGTIGFRNYDVEHKRREQSKQRKDCIKSSLFSVLDDDEDDENFAAFLAEKSSRKPQESKLYSMKSRTFKTTKRPSNGK